MKKKIGIFISFGLIIILCTAVILSVTLKVSYKPNIGTPDSINITNSLGKSGLYSAKLNPEHFQKLQDNYNNMFSRTYLSAIFAGQTEIKLVDQTTINPLINNYRVEFEYLTEQELTVNDKTYEKTYNKVIFEIANNEGFKEITIYFQQAENTSTYWYVTTYADTSEYFDYLETLTYSF